MFTDEQIKVAVDWWADKLYHCKFDNGDPSETGAMTMMMAVMGKPEVTEYQVQAFRDALTRGLKAIDKDSVTLGVDYHPDKILADSCACADINGITALPWKTRMWMDASGVKVAYGYQSPVEQLV